MSPQEGQFSGSLQFGPDDPTRVVVSVRGELDIATAGAFRELLAEAIAGGGRQLVIDMSQLDFLDAAGLGVIVGTASRLRPLGGHLDVHSPSASTYRTFEITKFTHVIHIERPAALPALAGNVGVLAAIQLTRSVLDAALALVVSMAQAVVAGADGVSLTLARSGRLSTVAASNDVVLEMDHDQYDTGEGPCLSAATEGQPFHLESLGHEGRWPAFVPRARARGIETILSTPLLSASGPIGALNIYSRTSGAFADREKRLADMFAAESATVIANAERAGSMDQLDQSLQQVLLSRRVIAQAQGMIMHRDHVSAAAAYAVLRQMSRDSRSSLGAVADGMLRSASEPRRPDAVTTAGVEKDPAPPS